MLLAAHSRLWGSSNLSSPLGKGNLIIFKCKISIFGVSIYTVLLEEAVGREIKAHIEQVRVDDSGVTSTWPLINASLQPVLQPGWGEPPQVMITALIGDWAWIQTEQLPQKLHLGPKLYIIIKMFQPMMSCFLMLLSLQQIRRLKKLQGFLALAFSVGQISNKHFPLLICTLSENNQQLSCDGHLRTYVS